MGLMGHLRLMRLLQLLELLWIGWDYSKLGLKSKEICNNKTFRLKHITF